RDALAARSFPTPPNFAPRKNASISSPWPAKSSTTSPARPRFFRFLGWVKVSVPVAQAFRPEAFSWVRLSPGFFCGRSLDRSLLSFSFSCSAGQLRASFSPPHSDGNPAAFSWDRLPLGLVAQSLLTVLLSFPRLC